MVVSVRVSVGVFVGAGVGVLVHAGGSVREGVGDIVGVWVREGIGVQVGLGDRVGVLVRSSVGVAEKVAVGGGPTTVIAVAPTLSCTQLTSSCARPAQKTVLVLGDRSLTYPLMVMVWPGFNGPNHPHRYG